MKTAGWPFSSHHWQRIFSLLPVILLVLLSCYYAAAYFYISLHTVSYPYQLEWLEGSVMDSAQRVLHGQPIYSKPTLKYSALLYTPLFYYAAAAFTWLFGDNFTAGRMVSFCSTIATCMLMYAWVRKEGGSRALSVVAPGLFLSTYLSSGQWFNLARVDSLFVMLTMAGLFTYSQYNSRQSAVMAGFLLFLAFFTKQQALLVLAPPMLFALFAWRERAVVTLCAFIFLTGAYVILLQYSTSGWFGAYVFTVPWTDPLITAGWYFFLINDVWIPMPVIVAIALAGVMYLLQKDWRKTGFYAALLGGSLAASVISRMHYGGYNNVIMPGYAGLSLVGVLMLQELIAHGLSRSIASAIMCLQLLAHYYDPSYFIPDDANYEAGSKMANYIARLHGNVFIPDMQFQQNLAGNHAAQYYTLGYDSYNAERNRQHLTGPTVDQQLMVTLSKQRFSAIILADPYGLPEKNEFYHFKEAIMPLAISYLRTGAAIVPRFVFVPNAHMIGAKPSKDFISRSKQQ